MGRAAAGRSRVVHGGLSDGLEFGPEDLADGFGEFEAETGGCICAVSEYAASWIGVGTAADGDGSFAAWVQSLDVFHGIAGPVAANEIVTERDTVAGVVGENRFEVTIRRVNSEYREVVIDRTAGSTAIEGKFQLTNTPCNLGRLAIIPRLDGSLDEAGFKVFCVLQDALPFSFRDRFAEQRVCAIANHWATVSVRSADSQPFAGQFEVF